MIPTTHLDVEATLLTGWRRLHPYVMESLVVEKAVDTFLGVGTPIRLKKREREMGGGGIFF